MSWLIFATFAIVLLGLAIVWRIWKLYGLISSPAFLLLILAFGYLTIYRIALPRFPQITSLGVALPFYVLALTAFTWLYRTLNNSICGPKLGPERHAYQRKRPNWLTFGNVLIVVFVLVVVLALLWLELAERY